VSADNEDLKTQLAGWRQRFLTQLENCPTLILDYASFVVTHLNNASIRVSPRRARLLSRSLLATSIVEGVSSEASFLRVLECSLPHVAWGSAPAREKVRAAHRAAWDEAARSPNAWIHQFLSLPKLADRLSLFLKECNDPDQGTQAMAQFVAGAPRDVASALAFAVFPKAVEGKLLLGAEGVNDLAKVASPILKFEGTLRWNEPLSKKNSSHPDFARFAKVLAGLNGARAERATQFFGWCLVASVPVEHPEALEQDLEACIQILRSL
jgi:MoxR-like ATPase